MNYKIGTACIITDDQTTFKSRPDLIIGTVTQKSMLALSPQKQREKLSNKVLQNLKALHGQLSYIASQDDTLRFFRISSNLLPMFDHPEFSRLYDSKLLFIVDHWLSKCKTIINDYNIRVSTHPDQYCVINSDKDHVRLNAIRTLSYHKYFMERLSDPCDGAVINIHLNGKLDYLPEYERNLIQSIGLQKWLSFENDDKGRADHEFTLSFCEKYGIRYVHDVHHHLVQSGDYLPIGHIDFKRIQATWGDIKPKMHISQSRDNDKIIRAHSDFITCIDLINYCKDLSKSYDLMIEAKAKNLAVSKLHIVI